jgi:hypothetical protein
MEAKPGKGKRGKGRQSTGKGGVNMGRRAQVQFLHGGKGHGQGSPSGPPVRGAAHCSRPISATRLNRTA